MDWLGIISVLAAGVWGMCLGVELSKDKPNVLAGLLYANIVVALAILAGAR